jgi:hypothetical protein
MREQKKWEGGRRRVLMLGGRNRERRGGDGEGWGGGGGGGGTGNAGGIRDGGGWVELLTIPFFFLIFHYFFSFPLFFSFLYFVSLQSLFIFL